MDNTFSTSVLFFTSAVAIALGYSIAVDPSLFYLCPDSYGANCISAGFREGVGRPLFETTYLIPVLFFALIFMRREVFSLWWKVILPFAGLGLLLVLLFPPIANTHLPARVFISEKVVWVLFVISVVTIVYKYIQLGKQKKQEGI